MKSEKELILLVKLYHSPVMKGGLLRKRVAWCKKDFERYLGYEDRSKELRQWIDRLVEIGVLADSGIENRNGKAVQVYVIEDEKLRRVMISNENYDLFWEMFKDKTFLGLPLDK